MTSPIRLSDLRRAVFQAGGPDLASAARAAAASLPRNPASRRAVLLGAAALLATTVGACAPDHAVHADGEPPAHADPVPEVPLTAAERETLALQHTLSDPDVDASFRTAVAIGLERLRVEHLLERDPGNPALLARLAALGEADRLLRPTTPPEARTAAEFLRTEGHLPDPGPPPPVVW